MSSLFNIPSINIDEGIVSTVSLSNDMKSDKYQLTFECTDIGERAFFTIYALLSDATYRTYFIPIQFLGTTTMNVPINKDAVSLELNVKLKGAKITNFTLVTNDAPYLEHVKTQTQYWDRIKDVTNNVGKLRADTLEGLINLTLNAFANASGTITQEDGVITFLDGTTVENSTMAVQVTGGAIRIASNKLPNGEWNWSTALTGAGINADSIVTGTLRAIDISGVNIIGTQQTATNITGVEINGSTIYSGDRTTGNYIELTPNGQLRAYKNNKRILMLNTSESGVLYLDNAGESTGLVLRSKGNVYGMEGVMVSTSNSDLILHAGSNFIKIPYSHTNPIAIQGDVSIDGDLNVEGHVNSRSD